MPRTVRRTSAVTAIAGLLLAVVGALPAEAASTVTLTKGQLAILKEGRTKVLAALAAGKGRSHAEWSVRVSSDSSNSLTTVPTMEIGVNQDGTGALCLIVLNPRDCDVWGGSGLTMAMDDAFTILDDAEGLRSPSEVLTTAQQDAISERADEQGSANPWLTFPDGSAVNAFVQKRYQATLLPVSLLDAGVPALAKRGRTTRVERFKAAGDVTVYRFTQNVGGPTLNGAPTKSLKVAYGIGADGVLEGASVWLDRTLIAEVEFTPGEPVRMPSPIAPASSIGFPGT